ncbi:MAG: hypothetical protein Q9219_005330 [cf. Caloplaca sp. 3 TL-2023]
MVGTKVQKGTSRDKRTKLRCSRQAGSRSSAKKAQSRSETPARTRASPQKDHETRENDDRECGLNTLQLEGILDKHLSRLLHSRDYPKTICPSEVARAFSESELRGLEVSDWRGLMDPVRAQLFSMRANGQVEILQKGEVVPLDTDPEDIRGPIRARLVQNK